MTESLLTSLMKLFAILASINKDIATALSRNFVYSFLKSQFNQKIVDQALLIYDNEILKLIRLEGLKESKRTSSLSVKVLSICQEINQGLHVRGKFLITINLIQFSKYFEDHHESSEEFRQTISDMVKTISGDLMINENEYNNCLTFITGKFYNVPEKEKLVIVSNINSFSFTKINFIQKDKLQGQFFFLKIQQADLILFYYSGMEKIELSSNPVFPGHIYIFPKGAAIKNSNISPIYYSEIEAGFLRIKSFKRISLQANNIEFQFPKSKNGIHKLNFSATSGDLFGIIGGSGTGKSTLLKILNGSYELHSGEILINGLDLHSGKKGIKGLIGYVPQDDLLLEELTVYQNLYFNAKLCLGDQDDDQINEAVTKYLNDLDLFYIKDLKVGSPLNKYISGGQRKRLNIALELIKEPLILLADEPTTGLSSTDSENVIQLLKELSVQGKIVMINIHQPSSDIFKLLDKLLILDKGGYAVYLGNPLDSFAYLKDIAERIDAQEIECPYCGNVQPDEILKVIEAKQVNEFGEYTSERVISPQRWYEMFQKNLQKETEPPGEKFEIPESRFKTPGRIMQFITYFNRNLLNKIADRQYALFALLISPILAVILGFFTKYVSGSNSNFREYMFINNVNLPAYIFMSVIVALFIGLIISAEEIIKDKKILERERFLNLSRISYINSKVVFLFILGAIQMILFVIISNRILEIKEMKLDYWLVLFSTSCFAIMLGLNISSSLKSVIAIYINIPFILVPLILLSGVIVKYDKMNYRISSNQYVPFVGDMMASRWGYEALTVAQFKNNKYQQYFYSVESKTANISYELNFLLPAVQNKIDDYERLLRNEQDSNKINQTIHIIRNSLSEIAEFTQIKQPELFTDQIRKELNLESIQVFLKKSRNLMILKNKEIEKDKDEIFQRFRDQGMTNSDITSLKERYFNRSISDVVLNTNEMNKIFESGDRFVRKDSPIYQIPSSKTGRSQFYAGTKLIGKYKIDTMWFNIMVLWTMTIILYLVLISNVLNKIFKKYSYSVKRTKR